MFVFLTGRGSARLERYVRDVEVGGSNPLAPIDILIISGAERLYRGQISRLRPPEADSAGSRRAARRRMRDTRPDKKQNMNYLGIDWGGTYIKAGVVNSNGKILTSVVFSSNQLKNKTVFINKIKELVDKFKSFKICAVGIGAPGIIDVKEEFIYYLPNVSGWENYPLKKVLQKRLRLPVFVGNDANLFGLAEKHLGAAKGVSNAILLTLGTGLGSSVIVNGKILQSQTSAAELGHVPIALNGIKCGCGGFGCIETLVGNKYILDKYRKLKKHSKVTEVREIYLKAIAKESQALTVWREFSFYLGMFLAGMVNVFNPQVIVFGGGVSGAFKVFKPLVLKVIKKQAMRPNSINLRLVKAQLKNPGIIGAAFLAKDNLKLK